MATLRTLFDLIEEKDRLVRLLSGYIDDPGLTITIGNEHRSQTLRTFSLITSTYFDGHQTGCVGIIGRDGCSTRARSRRSTACRAASAASSAPRTAVPGPTDRPSADRRQKARDRWPVTDDQ